MKSIGARGDQGGQTLSAGGAAGEEEAEHRVTLRTPQSAARAEGGCRGGGTEERKAASPGLRPLAASGSRLHVNSARSVSNLHPFAPVRPP